MGKMGKGNMRVRTGLPPWRRSADRTVSKQIPWYQGILQGILRFWAYLDGIRSKKPLCRNDFSRNSLRELSGKRF
jgi:hypothetical protein